MMAMMRSDFPYHGIRQAGRVIGLAAGEGGVKTGVQVQR